MAFELKSIPQILRDMRAAVLANSPINDMTRGSNISTILEAAATEDFNQYFQMLSIIEAFQLDNVTGGDLDDRAEEFGLDGRTQEQKATSIVTIGDSAFTKISTKIYAGLAGPTRDSTTIFVDSATGFPASGTIIIGRVLGASGTNVETIAYSSITTGTNFDTINLSAGLGNDHGTGESVILAQGGDRIIGAGTVVKVPATDFSADISYSINFETTILDGEDSVAGVEIAAVIAGSGSNVPANSINSFDTNPFPTATVTNLNSVTNGKDLETDEELRDRIKDTIQSLSRGTPRSLVTGVVGIVDPSDNKRVVSANLIDSTDVTDIAKLIIDDGGGFEPSFDGQGFEEVIADATGGEEFLQLDLFPLVKANSITINTEPYAILNNQTLVYRIDNDEEIITFVDSDFRVTESGSAQEVVTAINDRATLIEARTTEGRTKIEIQAKVNTNEKLTIVGGTANAVSLLNFPIGVNETLKLYKFDGSGVSLLEKDGTTAILETDALPPYDFSVSPSSLDIQMDGETMGDGTATAGSGVNTLIDTTLSNKFTVDTDLVNRFITFLTGTNAGLTAPIASYSAGSDTITLTGGLTVTIGDTYQIDDSERIFFSNVIGEDFLTPSSATSDEVIAVINKKLKGVASKVSSNSKILLTSKTENSSSSKIKVLGGTANAILSFSTIEVVGKNRDYILNRFNGQIKLNVPLLENQVVTAGTRLSRGFLISGFSQPYSLLDGDTIDIKIDGGSDQTVTFNTADFSDITQASAAEVIIVINTDLIGGTAEVTEDNRVLIRTNTFDETLGSIEITAATGNATNLGFTLNSIVSSIKPHFAFILSANGGPYNFVEGDRLVVVLDNDSVGKTFDIPLDLDGEVTSVTGTPAISFIAKISAIDQAFINKFTIDDILKNMKLIWKTATNGANVDVERTVENYDSTNGIITLNLPLPADVTAADTFIILPVTVVNVVDYLNNTATSTFSISGVANTANNGTRVQLSTLTDGGDGFINITGGTANALTTVATQNGSGFDIFVENALFQPLMDVTVDDDDSSPVNTDITTVTPNDPTIGTFKLTMSDSMADFSTDQNASITRINVLGFDTDPVQGIDSYRFFTGLLRRVQRTVDGFEQDQAFQGLRAAGVQIEVKAPTVQQLRFEIDIVLEDGLSISVVIDDIKNAVSSYVNSTRVGEDIILNEIIRRVKGITGVADLSIISPLLNVPIADGEIARVSDNDIVIG